MKKRILAFLVALATLFTPVLSSAETVQQKNTTQTNITNAIIDYLKKNYQFEFDEDKALKEVVKTVLNNHPELYNEIATAIMGTLDEYSKFYTKDEFEAFFSQVESEYAGIGAYLTRKDGNCVVTGFLKDSPAQKSGIAEGDVILKINGEDVAHKDPDYVASKAKGDENTPVIITVSRDGLILDFTVIRATLRGNTVNYTLLDNSVGYLDISNFSSQTGEEVTDAVRDLKNRGADRFIVDLRNNPGGVTGQALLSASVFLPKDAPMLTVKSKSEGDYVYTNPNSGKIEKLVVLVNENSASAAEIFTAAIKDNKAGTIIGTKTYGKGTMQNTIGLGDFGGIKVTSSEFLTPNGDMIYKVGITPDILVANKTRYATANDFAKLTFENKFYAGDEDEQIAALKSRLAAMGYFRGTNDSYFDTALFNAVTAFQSAVGLYPCGDLDFSTQIAISNMVSETKITEDTQFNTAFEYIVKK